MKHKFSLPLDGIPSPTNKWNGSGTSRTLRGTQRILSCWRRGSFSPVAPAAAAADVSAAVACPAVYVHSVVELTV